MKLLLVLFFSLVALTRALAVPVDELKATLPGLQGRERLAALADLAHRTETRAPQQALAFATEGIALARALGDQEKEAALLGSIAFCYGQTGDFPLSVQFGKDCLALGTKLQSKDRIAKAHNILGITYTYMGLFSQALAEHLESLRLREELSLETASIQSLNNIGIVYHNMGNYEKAITYYNEVLKRLSSQPDSSRLILIKLNIGFAQYKLGRLAEALKHHQEAMELIAMNNNTTLIAYAYLNLGMTYTDLKQYDKAKHYLQRAMTEYGRQDQKHGRLQVLNAQARLYLATGQDARALACAKEAVGLAGQITSRNELMTSCKLVSDLYQKAGDSARSFEYFKRYATTRDSIFSLQESDKIASINNDIASLKKDQELDSLKKEKTISALKIEKAGYSSTALITSVALMALATLILITYNKRIGGHKRTLEQANSELARLNRELHDTVGEIRTLTGLLPICAHCKKIRNDSGYWEQLEGYISEHSSATFSHGICPPCAEALYPGSAQRVQEKRAERG